MTVQLKWLRGKAGVMTLGVVMGLASALGAWGQGQRLPALVAEIDPSVVRIKIGGGKGFGTGFVVDPSGLILTSYTTIEGASKLEVSFPADKDKKTFEVEGFVAILREKGLALIRIQPGDKKLQPLTFADEPPIKGERVAMFASPMGLPTAVTDGVVSALHTGAELHEVFQEIDHGDLYTARLGFDLDAEWIQTTAPVSPGCTGGPLVNAQGKVIGVLLWTFGDQPRIGFCLTAAHVRKFLDQAGKKVRPLSELPPKRTWP